MIFMYNQCKDDIEEFKKLYDEVFTENDMIKNCGRDKTSALIACCNKISSNSDFGSIDSGFLNVENIIRLHQNITINTMVTDMLNK